MTMARGIDTDGCSHCADDAAPDIRRTSALRHALTLQYLTVSWNVVEGMIAVAAAASASSVALLAFGIDSFVECTSSAVMIWRLRAEHAAVRVDAAHIAQIERRAQKLVAASLFLLAAYVCFDAAISLWSSEKPEFSAIGVVLTSVSLAVMLFLARAKRRAAAALESRALEADAFQTTACWWLSLATLAGVTLNGAFGWWWADPLAAFVIAGLVIKEGKEAWEGEHDCC
jgi:divalent metal cation (Fe/Co/Zn/Cd) transporter